MTEEPIAFNCPACDKVLKVKAKGAGKSIRCPGCNASVTVPTPDSTGVSTGVFDPFKAMRNAPSPQRREASSPPPIPPIPPIPTHAATQEADNATLQESSPVESPKADLPQSESSAAVGAIPNRVAVTAPATPDPYASPAAVPELSISSPIQLPQQRTYPVLLIVASVYRYSAYVMIVLTAIFISLTLVVNLSTGRGDGVTLLGALGLWLLTSVPAALAATLVAVFLIMNAELIMLGLHVQENTLATAHAVRQRHP